jgi:Flp pilus assembly protein TadG
MKAGLLRDEGANAAVEFALVVPVMFTLVLGIISMCAMFFSQASMHMAAESTARYWAVSDAGWTISGNCSFSAPLDNSSATIPVSCTAGNTVGSTTYVKPVTYAKSYYFGASMTGLTFTPSTGQCTASGGSFGGPGVIVAGSGTYNFNAMFVNLPIHVSTTACYPIIE